MFQVFARSFKGLNLSPGERAAMKLVEGWLLTAVGAGGAIAFQQLTSGNADYRVILPSAGGAALLTLVLSVKKYLSSQSDLPLPVPSLATRTPEPAPVLAAVVQPGQQFTTPVPQPPSQFMPPPPQMTYQPSSTFPEMPTMPGGSQ